ncbi:hypothetical protein HDU67_006910 [Dinochytrium kinnereticum]|nr:hypothetical protein HDU67_006910 [Dinochytrium kinnereticum]
MPLHLITNLATRLLDEPLHPTHQPLFMRREVFKQVNGVPEQPVLEMYEFARRVRRLGRIFVCDGGGVGVLGDDGGFGRVCERDVRGLIVYRDDRVGGRGIGMGGVVGARVSGGGMEVVRDVVLMSLCVFLYAYLGVSADSVYGIVFGGRWWKGDDDDNDGDDERRLPLPHTSTSLSYKEELIGETDTITTKSTTSTTTRSSRRSSSSSTTHSTVTRSTTFQTRSDSSILSRTSVGSFAGNRGSLGVDEVFGTSPTFGGAVGTSPPKAVLLAQGTGSSEE